MSPNPHSSDEIAAKVAKARVLEAQGLNRTQVAWALGITDVTLRRWLRKAASESARMTPASNDE